MVVCFIPQTSYIECLYNNIPTILVGNKKSFFDTNKRLKILKGLKKIIYISTIWKKQPILLIKIGIALTLGGIVKIYKNLLRNF